MEPIVDITQATVAVILTTSRPATVHPSFGIASIG
jgi:hypothetical protein